MKRPKTVADLCKERGDCRDGLGGLAMRHLPSGIEFLCEGSCWSDHDTPRLLIYPLSAKGIRERIADARRYGQAQALGKVEEWFPRFEVVCLADVEPVLDPVRLKASDCVLLDEWPER